MCDSTHLWSFVVDELSICSRHPEKTNIKNTRFTSIPTVFLWFSYGFPIVCGIPKLMTTRHPAARHSCVMMIWRSLPASRGLGGAPRGLGLLLSLVSYQWRWCPLIRRCSMVYIILCITGWWFGNIDVIFFHSVGNNHPQWRIHIFQRGSNHQPDMTCFDPDISRLQSRFGQVICAGWSVWCGGRDGGQGVSQLLITCAAVLQICLMSTPDEYTQYAVHLGIILEANY